MATVPGDQNRIVLHKFRLAALAASADDTMIRAITIGHQEIQQAVAFSTGHAVLKAGPDWAATVAAAKSGARQKAQK